MSSEVAENRGRLIAERRQAVGFRSRGAMYNASVQLEVEDPSRFKAFSISSLRDWEQDETGERIARANNKTLRTLAYLLGWVGEDFHMRLGVSIGSVPRLEETKDQRIFTFIERFGTKYKPSVRLPVFGSVAAGINGFDLVEEPDHYEVFDESELPSGIDRSKLYLVWANGNSMYEEGMTPSIPNGSKLMVEHGAAPDNKQVVVAYIPERDIGVVKQFWKNPTSEEVMLRSFQRGGPYFSAKEYPDMHVSGVVRRVVFDL
jgi:SOS-response transcriptional repressor LexA